MSEIEQIYRSQVISVNTQKQRFHTLHLFSYTIECNFIKVDLDKPLEEQGPFDLIIQKITDYMAAVAEGDTQALKTLKGLEVKLTRALFLFSMQFAVKL